MENVTQCPEGYTTHFASRNRTMMNELYIAMIRRFALRSFALVERNGENRGEYEVCSKYIGIRRLSPQAETDLAACIRHFCEGFCAGYVTNK